MKILAIEHEVAGAAKPQSVPLRKAEAQRAWELYQEGTLREFYFRHDRHEAVLILESNDVDDARRSLGTLPFVREGLIRFEVIALSPYSGFARLFAGEQ